MMPAQTQTTYSRLTLDVRPPIARMFLSHPPLNIIDVAMMEELAHALAEIEAHSGISIIVISGDGNSFSAGVDVAAHAPDKVESMLAKFHKVIRALVCTKKITIASIRGYCLGGGAELAMVCDMAYSTESAQWGFPEIKLGCYPPVAATALASLVGQKRAADLILTGRTISGAQAAEMGLANRAVPDGDLTAVVEESVQRLASLSSASLAITKKAIYAWDSMHFDKGLARAEKIYLEELMKTEDAQEGLNAFLEKRRPKWKGK